MFISLMPNGHHNETISVAFPSKHASKTALNRGSRASPLGFSRSCYFQGASCVDPRSLVNLRRETTFIMEMLP
jgi:hypothetical protein